MLSFWGLGSISRLYPLSDNQLKASKFVKVSQNFSKISKTLITVKRKNDIYTRTRGSSASIDGRNERKASDNGIKPCKNYTLYIFSLPGLSWSLTTLPFRVTTVLRRCLEEPCGGAITAATSLTH